MITIPGEGVHPAFCSGSGAAHFARPGLLCKIPAWETGTSYTLRGYLRPSHSLRTEREREREREERERKRETEREREREWEIDRERERERERDESERDREMRERERESERERHKIERDKSREGEERISFTASVFASFLALARAELGPARCSRDSLFLSLSLYFALLARAALAAQMPLRGERCVCVCVCGHVYVGLWGHKFV